MSDNGMKRPHEDEEDMSDLKKRRGEGPHIEFRALIPSKSAGAVIGRGGTNIRRLRQDFKASVTVPDSQGPERILTLGANVGTVCEILLELLPELDSDRGSDEVEMRFLIHQSQAGGIIGRAGFKIKELREETGTNIKVYTQPAPQSTERCVSVTGKPSNIVNCIAAIYDILESAPPKGFNQPYDPHNFDEFYAADYGGYSFGEKRGGEGRGGPMGGMRGSRGGGGGPRGRMGRGGMDGGGRGGSRGGHMGGMGGGGMGGGGMGGGGMRGGRGGGSMNGMNRGAAGGMGDFTNDGLGGMGGQGMMFGNQQSSSTQVSIPKDLAGAIIGKGGTRIRQIRQESGANITIDEALPGATDRIITITGGQEAIQNAQYLLQMSVKQFSGKY